MQQRHNARVEATGAFTNSVTNHIALGIIVIYGGFQVIKGQLTLGAFTTIAIYMKQLSELQSSLGHLFLLLKLYELDKGEILIDDYNINTIKNIMFYKQIGVALQEPYLWNDTIENNIKYSRENACKISGGQKQRIAIARALIKNPKIIILDEALSSVDAELEGKIINNIKNYFKDITIIVISHRFSAINKMDIICFLDDNMYIDTHQGLMEKNSHYQKYMADQIYC